MSCRTAVIQEIDLRERVDFGNEAHVEAIVDGIGCMQVSCRPAGLRMVRARFYVTMLHRGQLSTSFLNDVDRSLSSIRCTRLDVNCVQVTTSGQADTDPRVGRPERSRRQGSLGEIRTGSLKYQLL